jgi:phage-related protein
LRLAECGHELRRPLADFLREGIHELRIRKGRVNYRILYFFHGRNVAILAHALTKEDEVPKADIERSIRRKKAFEAGHHGIALRMMETGPALLCGRPGNIICPKRKTR